MILSTQHCPGLHSDWVISVALHSAPVSLASHSIPQNSTQPCPALHSIPQCPIVTRQCCTEAHSLILVRKHLHIVHRNDQNTALLGTWIFRQESGYNYRPEVRDKCEAGGLREAMTQSGMSRTQTMPSGDGGGGCKCECNCDCPCTPL